MSALNVAAATAAAGPSLWVAALVVVGAGLVGALVGAGLGAALVWIAESLPSRGRVRSVSVAEAEQLIAEARARSCVAYDEARCPESK